MQHEDLSEFEVLVVEDDALMSDIEVDILKQAGFECVSSKVNGKEALERVRDKTKRPVDIIFCDLQMPEMDGVEFLRHLADAQYERFVVLISGEDASILHTAHNLAKGHNLRVLGAIEKPLKLQDIYELVRGMAKYEIKRAPHNHPAILPADLERGIGANELILFFQPKTSISTGKVHSVEALVRWIHPRYGLVPPVAFISVAEEHGLIDYMTEKIFSMALKNGAYIRQKGFGIMMACNLSMDSLDRYDLPEILEGKANDAGFSCENTMIEITESRLMKNIAMTLEILARMRLKGFALSIDDFGTGTSNIEKLRDAPFSEMKIDRSFISKARDSSKAAAILKSSVELGNELGLAIVAEGVETQSELDLVTELGCQLVQGFYIARPMPMELLIPWLRKQSLLIRGG